MNISGIQSGLAGMAIWDAWDAAFKKTHHIHGHNPSPLLAAASKAFESYLNAQNAIHSAEIQAVAYMLNPGGSSASLVNSQQIAPFLALNIMA